jgi:hypothetical protein
MQIENRGPSRHRSRDEGFVAADLKSG